MKKENKLLMNLDVKKLWKIKDNDNNFEKKIKQVCIESSFNK